MQCCPTACCPPPAPRMVTKTCFVEEKCERQVCKTVMCEKEVTCQVPRWCTVEEEKEITVCVPVMTKEIRTRQVQVCKMVEEEKEIEVCVPVKCMVEKEVCCRVPVTSYVCAPPSCNSGCGQSCNSGCGQSCNSGCGQSCNSGCAPAPRAVTTSEMTTKKIQVPVCTMTKEKKMVKCCKSVMTCEDQQYEVSVCKMEQQTKIVKCCKKVCTMETVTKKVCVPTKITCTEYVMKKRPVTYCEAAPAPCAPTPSCCSTGCSTGCGGCSLPTSRRC